MFHFKVFSRYGSLKKSLKGTFPNMATHQLSPCDVVWCGLAQGATLSCAAKHTNGKDDKFESPKGHKHKRWSNANLE